MEGNTLKVNNRPLRVLPDDVIEKLQNTLRNVETESVELTEEDNKPVYRVKARVKGRLLFILPVEVPVEAVIDAESGAELKVSRPWWSFLVFP